LSLITEVGAPLNASIRSGAGFGTLVMAVVMLIRTVSPWRQWHARHTGPDSPLRDGFDCRKTISIPLEQI
jgi:hypothetical protein